MTHTDSTIFSPHIRLKHILQAYFQPAKKDFEMARVKKFDLRNILNRNRVRRCRLKKQLREGKIEENHIHTEFQRSVYGSVMVDTVVPLRDRLKMWSSEHRITGRAINDLLSILNKTGKHTLI